MFDSSKFLYLIIYNMLLGPYVKNNVGIKTCIDMRQDVHTYNTTNCKVVDIPYQRLSKSQNSYKVELQKGYPPSND